MSRFNKAVAAAALMLSTFAATLPAQSAPSAQAGRLAVDGVNRTYLLYVPSTYHPSHPTSLVLVFHGAGASPRSMARHTGFSALAEREGFVVAYPAGLGRRWNDGRGYGTHDDVAFVRALLDTLSRQLAIDPKRIYATGISNGAMFSYRLACDLPGVFAAIAPVAGAMPDALLPACAHGTPVALAAFQGTADPLVPYGGGGVARRRGQVLSAIHSAELWAQAAECTGAPATALEPDRAPSDGMRVRRTEYPGCKEGRDIELYTIEGGGHTWPGGPASGPTVGRVTHDIDATMIIWSFFSRHPKP
ncbi:MAG: extracellular catalytic domain type 1 short-chain-length polyhydroxyalkanoate depolymerase [Gemmatimonadales bacterium]